MKPSPKPLPSRILKTALVICGLAALTPALSALAQQQTVFYDTFGSSTLNAVNALPGGTPTASWTSYTVASAKVATSTTNAPGHLRLITAATSSGNSEIQAVFTKYPVTLATLGDYVELNYTFTDSTNILGGNGGNSSALFAGIFNSHGVPPLGGTVLWNSGLSSATTADVGGTAGWVGYNLSMYDQQTANTSPWYVGSRPVQTTVNNADQGLLYNYPQAGSSHSQSASAEPFPFPNLTVGSQYTVQLRVTLSAAGTLTVSNGLYAGVGTGGTFIFGNVGNFTGTALVTTNFDGLGIGYRASDSLSTHVPWTNDINSITVFAGLAAQAGPYFVLTSSGNGCGGATLGLSGSVTTNVYLLYTNGVFNGNALAGTGSPLNFGPQTSPAVYTIVASNTVNQSVGPMDGSQTVSETAPVIVLEPASVSGVTNAPFTFSVAATGNTLSYQWYRNGVALANGGEISGAQTTNLVISAAQAADAVSTANGYYVVTQDPCGDSVTSSPNASLTLLAPNNLVWQGGNPDSTWDLATTLNFTNQTGAFEAFTNGDNTTFDDTSANLSVTLATNLVASLVTVNGTQNYDFSGPGSLNGFTKLIVNDSGVTTFANSNNYTGGTLITSNATLSLGDGSSAIGSVTGVVTINTNGTLLYNFAANANIYNSLAGNGTVNYQSGGSGTLTIPTTSAVSSNFTGTINLATGVRLHASDGNAGYAFGNGSTVNVPAYSQAWCDRSSTSYNNVFNIAGTGWLGGNGGNGAAAISLYGCTLNGAINLQADSRIGGTINGGTIQGPISGNYQLEVWGTAGSYVLNLGPTNGVNSYAGTLITSGSVEALNTNAIGTGPVTLDLAGDLRLNGNNLTISNLSSTDSGNVTGNGATVENINSTTAATLTVGTDGTSTEFDGTFFNGGAAALSLNKIGAGTLTLTGVNTNTGTVAVNGGTIALSGSGSFNNASVIAPASGAVYDVTATGNPLTLNSGQTLKGSGTVNGGVLASAGSTVNPGDTIGALTVSGNLTLGGAVLMELNRTNAPATNDSLIVTGTLTAGGTLTVTNLGPALHPGDSFQLFGTGASGLGASGFTAVNLPTSDLANHVIYSWNNNLGGNGTISVATVTSLVNPNPPKIQVSVTNNTLSLAWPTNAGWTLLTNSVGLTATAQWYPYPNSASLTNVSIPLNPAKTNVFFRMAYPYP